jgi:23S rRNA pseudouridine1911/1915/1917 synthase
MAKGVQEAVLEYRVVGMTTELSKVAIRLITGRTHQIRAQFSSRGLPLVGDRKYSLLEDDCEIALWSHRLLFRHPSTGELMDFQVTPPDDYPWHLL